MMNPLAAAVPLMTMNDEHSSSISSSIIISSSTCGIHGHVVVTSPPNTGERHAFDESEIN